MFRLVVLVALFSASSVAASGGYKQVIDGDSMLITLEDPEFYALTDPELKQFNWASVNILATQIGVVTPDCQSNQEAIKDLGDVEQRVLESVTKRLKDMQQSGSGSQSLKRISLGNNREILYRDESANSSKMYTMQHEDISLELFDDKHYAIQTKSLADESIKWLLINGELVTFVYSDGRSIRMQPLECLDRSKRNLLRGLYDEIVAAKDNLKLSYQIQYNILTERLTKEFREREQQEREKYYQYTNRLESENTKRELDERTKHNTYVDRLEREYQQSKQDKYDRHRQLIDRLEREQQGHDAEQKKRDQQVIDRYERENGQQVVEERSKHMQLVERMEREYRQNEESQRTNHRAIISRLERENNQRESDETANYHRMMERLEREHQERRRNLDVSLRKALETPTWLKI